MFLIPPGPRPATFGRRFAPHTGACPHRGPVHRPPRMSLPIKWGAASRRRRTHAGARLDSEEAGGDCARAPEYALRGGGAVRERCSEALREEVGSAIRSGGAGSRRAGPARSARRRDEDERRDDEGRRTRGRPPRQGEGRSLGRGGRLPRLDRAGGDAGLDELRPRRHPVHRSRSRSRPSTRTRSAARG